MSTRNILTNFQKKKFDTYYTYVLQNLLLCGSDIYGIGNPLAGRSTFYIKLPTSIIFLDSATQEQGGWKLIFDGGGKAKVEVFQK